jgi:ubiquinone/menaquinone biosynthesis C-methylase UbiE
LSAPLDGLITNTGVSGDDVLSKLVFRENYNLSTAGFIIYAHFTIGKGYRKIPMSLFTRIKHKAARVAAAFQPLPTPGQAGTRNQATRDAWLQATLAAIPAGSRILDAGAGELKYKSLCAHLNYVSQDFAQYDGKGDGRGMQTGAWDQTKLDIVSDIANIPEPDASFDAVMCIEVLEHIPHPVDALRELARLLKPGGVLIVTAPFCSITHFAPYFFQTGYSRYFYEHWLGQFGFTIEDMQFNGSYFEYLAQELRRLPSMGTEYTGIQATLQEREQLNGVLALLNRMAQADKGSEQVLCYGLHVKARKL